MYPQAAGHSEALGTLDTAIGFLPRVSPFVLFHGVSVAESPVAVGAAVGSLTGVDPQVPPQVASLGKAFGAPGAAVGPLPRVDAVVAPQVSRLGEGLTAPVTGIGLLVLEVEVEAGRLAETLPTAGAAVWASLLVVGGDEVVTLVVWQHPVLGPRLCFTRLLVMYGCVMEL